MLIELGQLICSAGISNVYKPVKQGKELQQFILDNAGWCYWYYHSLCNWAENNINMKSETKEKLLSINEDFAIHTMWNDAIVPTHAYFRYAKEYKCDIPSKTLLPIDECISEYKKYLEWKIKR